MSIRLVTDSTAYLPPALVGRYEISVVPLSVSFGEDSALETDIDLDDFYRRLAASPTLPTSSQPSTASFVDAFSRATEAGHEVLGVFISGEMSGTLQGAERAREMVLAEHPEAVIELVDSRSNCMQLGFCVLGAADAAEEGAALEEAADLARSITERSRFLFTPATLEYLKRGGRIGGASALLGAALKIRPILSVEGGETVSLARVRTQKKALAAMMDMLERDAAEAGLEELVAHHIGDEAAGEALAAELGRRFGREVPLVPVGPVVGLHVGPGTVGFVYQTREPIHGG